MISISLALGVNNIFLMMFSYKRISSHNFDHTVSMLLRINKKIVISNSFVFMLMKTQKYTGHIGKNQVGMVLKSSGVNILMTSLISISVFLIAAVVPIPALRAFCLQVAILVIFVLVTTFFGVTSLISFDIRRRRSARIDIFCCFPSEVLRWPFFKKSHSTETPSTIDGQMREFTENTNSTPISSNLLLVSC